MSENTLPSTPDTKPIHRLIRRTRQWLRSSWVATGAGITTGLLVGALVAVTLVDLAQPLWPIFRLVALLLVMVPATAALLVGVVWPLLRRLSEGQVAHRIEATIPKMHNRLVSCIDLDHTERQQRQSVVFFRRLIGEVQDRLKGFKPSSVIDRQQLRRAATWAGATLTAFVIALFLFSDRLPTAMARVFSPFADIPPASGVVYDVQPGDAKMLRGEEIPFVVNVEKGEPDQLRLELKPDDGKETLWYDLQKQNDGKWTLNLTGLESSFAYRVHGGGTWTTEHRITLLDRPTITGLHTVLHYPKYMELPEPRVGPPQVAEVEGPQYSAVDVVVQVEGDVATGEIEILEPKLTRTKLPERPERQWFAGKIPAGARPEGNWPEDPSPRKRQPSIQGLHSHGFSAAPGGFQVQKGELLYAYVAIPADKRPETIMLQWQSGNRHEHRAVWGADKIPVGTMDTPSYRRMGPIPASGDMVRLEVPAELVDLEGKSLQGMTLALFNGQATLRGAGALGSDETERTDFAVVKTFPMQASAEHEWSGKFPLDRDGRYRVALRNELQHPNKTMKEAKYIAINDQPPMVVLERPGMDITVGEPVKVPLVITAYDDFGLADLTLHFQRGDNAPFETKSIKRYARPVRNDTVLTTIDVAELKLKPGEFVRYHIEARDRKNQSTMTKDFTIRLSADKNGADKELANFEKAQDPFMQNLEKLIAQQEKVREQVEKTAAKFQDATEKAQEAKAQQEAKAKAEGAQQPSEQMPKLDPETEKKLEELRKELAELAKQEAQNTQLGEQMAENLKQLAEQAGKLQMLPPQLAKEMQELRQMFQDRAVQPLKDMTAQMNKGADAKKSPPDLKQLQGDANRLQKELEAMRDRMKALANAEQQMRDNAEQALAQLQKEMQQQNAGMTARELEELQKALEALRKELAKLEGQQEKVMADNDKNPLSEQQKQQAALDPKENQKLAATKELQGSEQMKRARRQPNFPQEPYTPENGDKVERPREQDTPEQQKSNPNGDKKDQAGKPDGDKDMKEAIENMFMPALGGPKPKLDPRYADRQRPMPQQSGKDALEAHQNEQMAKLDAAQQSLKSDEQKLAEMREQLERARQAAGQPNGDKDQASAQNEGQRKNQSGGNPDGDKDQRSGRQRPNQQDANSKEEGHNKDGSGGKPDGDKDQRPPQPGQAGEEGQPGQGDAAMEQLNQLMQSAAMREAMQMAARLRQMRGQQGQPQQNPHGGNANEHGITSPTALEADLAKLDPATRSVILKMKPKLREELLQGMRDAGPEGYQRFIDDYFKRLTEVKK